MDEPLSIKELATESRHSRTWVQGACTLMKKEGILWIGNRFPLVPFLLWVRVRGYKISMAYPQNTKKHVRKKRKASQEEVKDVQDVKQSLKEGDFVPYEKFRKTLKDKSSNKLSPPSE